MSISSSAISASTLSNRVLLGLPTGLLLPCCCCLPTPMTLASGGSPIIPACGPPVSFYVHLASSAVTPSGSVHKSRGDNVGAVEEMMCFMCVLQRGHSGDRSDLATTLCKYDLRKGDLFVLSWARVQ